MKRITFFAALVLSVTALALTAQADSRDWSLVDLNGHTFSTAEQLGDSPALLLFWATWCAPCKKELSDHRDYLNELAAQGVHVLLIAEDNPKTQARVKPYVESKKFPWPVLLDPDGELLKRYGGSSLPFTVLLDKEGQPVQTVRGALQDTRKLKSQIDGLMGGSGE